MSQLFTSITFEVKIGGFWRDISEDVCHTPSPKWNVGIMSNSVLDRVGDPEILKFSLRNDSYNAAGLKGFYTPDHTNKLAGWTSGLDVRLTFNYDGISHVKYYGTIDTDGIDVQAGELGQRRVDVTCHGFMSKAASHNLNLMTLQSNLRIEQAVAYILANMPVQPTGTSYATGQSTFPYAFDTVTKKTRAIAEFQKLAMSELSYIYTKSDGTLVVEGRNTRTDVSINNTVPKMYADCGFMLMETGSNLLTEDGYKIILDESQEPDFSGLALFPGAKVSFGDEVANYVSGVTHPRKIDAAATTTLFTLQKSMAIDAGETLTGVRGQYRDPSGGASYVSGSSMVAPTTPTHYQMFSNEDGTGTDLSANLVVTPTYGTDAVSYTLYNSSGTNGWITKLNAVGKGIYLYDPVTVVQQDTASQTTHGLKGLDFDMQYQSTPSVGVDFSVYILRAQKDPSTKVSAFPMLANRSTQSMLSFLYLEPGMRNRYVDTLAAIDADYYIQGYEAVLISGMHVIWTPILKQALVLDGWILGTSALSIDTTLGSPPFG